MELILVRHAPAEAISADSPTDDAHRRLTPVGRRKMQAGAAGLVVAASAPHILATSPLVRAVETAELIGEAYDRVMPETVSELKPGAGPDALVAWLRHLSDDNRVLAVGHEPDLSILAAVLITGQRAPFFEFKKGGACLLDVPAGIIPGTSALRWFLTPRQLRRLVEPSD